MAKKRVGFTENVVLVNDGGVDVIAAACTEFNKQGFEGDSATLVSQGHPLPWKKTTNVELNQLGAFVRMQVQTADSVLTTKEFRTGTGAAKLIVVFTGVEAKDGKCLLVGKVLPPEALTASAVQHHKQKFNGPAPFTKFRIQNDSTYPIRKANYLGTTGPNRTGGQSVPNPTPPVPPPEPPPRRVVDEANPGPAPGSLPRPVLFPQAQVADDVPRLPTTQVRSITLTHSVEGYESEEHTLVISGGDPENDDSGILDATVSFQGVDLRTGLFIARVAVHWADGLGNQVWDPEQLYFY